MKKFSKIGKYKLITWKLEAVYILVNKELIKQYNTEN